MSAEVVRISVSASIDGRELQVEGATITLGVNAIPRIELQCVPTESEPSPKESSQVIRPTILEYAKLYREMSKDARGLSKRGNVSISIEETSGNNDNLKLNDWVFSGVGLSSISAIAAPHLAVILEHPICMLTKVGSLYSTPKSKADDKLNLATEDASDFLDVLVKAYACAKYEVEYYETENGLAEEMLKSLGTKPYAPEDYLVYKGGKGIFLGGDGEEKKRIAQAIARTVFPTYGGASTWDTIVGASGSLLLSVTQDNENNFTTGKLVLEPTRPWKAADLTIDDGDCSSTEIPGMDPFMLTGVMAQKPYRSYDGGHDEGFTPKAGSEKSTRPQEVLYMPVKDVGMLDGRIMKVNAPQILCSAFARDAAYSNSGFISDGKISIDAKDKDYVDKAVLNYCKAVYEISACSMVQGSAQLPLHFRDSKGELILPGRTCRFVSDGKDVYYGYVRQVVHAMSSKGGCSTTVLMSHVRPEADFKIGGKTAIKAGSDNAAYE